MALGATQDHKDSAVLVEADLKELAESLGQILRLLAPLVAQDDKRFGFALSRVPKTRPGARRPFWMILRHALRL